MLWFFIYLIPGQMGIYKFWFKRKRENWSTRKKPLGAKERTNNKLYPHNYGINVHWWKVTAITTQ